MLTDYAAQPQSGADGDGQRQPENGALSFDPDLVCLHLLQVQRSLLYRRFMHRTTMETGSLLPISYCAFVKTECGNDRLNRAAVGQQRNHLTEELSRILPPIERRPFRLSKCSLTDTTLVAPFLPTMDAYAATTHNASCRTALVGAEYLGRVHESTLLVFR